MDRLKHRLPHIKFKRLPMTFIFDLDGTIFNTRKGNCDFYESILGRQMTDLEAQYCFTHSMPDSIRILFGDRAPEAMETIGQIGVGKMVDGAVPEKNAIGALIALKRKGYRLALNSNRTTAVKALLSKWDIGDLFDMVVTSLDVEKGKPDPEGCLKIMSVLGKDAVYVGDSDIDMQVAERAGIPFIRYGVDITDMMEVTDGLREEETPEREVGRGIDG